MGDYPLNSSAFFRPGKIYTFIYSSRDSRMEYARYTIKQIYVHTYYLAMLESDVFDIDN